MLLRNRKSNDTKYLEIYIDHNIKWGTHYKYMNSKISEMIYKFVKQKTYSFQHTKLILIESLRTYGIYSWGNGDKSR